MFEIKLSNVTIYIDIYDNPLAKKWIKYLKDLVSNKFMLEKNYCFVGWPESERNVEFLCDRITESVNYINSFDWKSVGLPSYTITHQFTPETCIIQGDLKAWTPAGRVNHETLNWLHRYFEELQGTSGGPSHKLSDYYKKADNICRYHIRQLNILCHEFETFCLSHRKLILEPEWIRPSQLMCWLHAPRFELKDGDFDSFGLNALDRELGGVYMGVNKAVGKHHYEVFRDEDGKDIDHLISIAMRGQTLGAGDFDIEWGETISIEKSSWHKEHIKEFKQWLIKNNLDPSDKLLTIGHPKVGQVDLIKSFGTNQFAEIYNILKDQLNVQSITVDDKTATYDYTWKDDNIIERQIKELY